MARPAGELRPPGVYTTVERIEKRRPGLEDTRIAAFVGLAVKGPLDVPTRVSSWDEFVEVFGSGDIGYLGRSVEGFFVNGGVACHVVRVAHRVKPGETAGPEHASCAERIVKDGWDKPALRVRAQTEGKWGNNVWVRFNQTTGAKALLTTDLEVGSGEASVNLTRGFEK